MTVTNRAPRKSLDFLSAVPKAAQNAMAEVPRIDLSLIDADPKQPRKSFGADEHEFLVGSIKEKGILQPLLVRTGEKGRYVLIAGERRLRAAREAGLKDVPAFVRDDLAGFSVEQIELIQLVENTQRLDLSDVELALSCRRILKASKMTQRQLAASIGRHESTMSRLMRLLDGEWAELVENGLITSAAVLERVRALDEVDRERLIASAVESGEEITWQRVDEVVQAARAAAASAAAEMANVDGKDGNAAAGFAEGGNVVERSEGPEGAGDDELPDLEGLEDGDGDVVPGDEEEDDDGAGEGIGGEGLEGDEEPPFGDGPEPGDRTFLEAGPGVPTTVFPTGVSGDGAKRDRIRMSLKLSSCAGIQDFIAGDLLERKVDVSFDAELVKELICTIEPETSLEELDDVDLGKRLKGLIEPDSVVERFV